MPTISVPLDRLPALLPAAATEPAFAERCFRYGVEVDGRACEDGRDVLRVDIPANRYDLLSAEGLCASLALLDGAPARHPRVLGERHTVRARPVAGRPYLAAAVVRGAAIDVASFIETQDRLGTLLGRRRALVSVGTHELAAVRFPLTYAAEPPDALRFRPLRTVRAFPDGEPPTARDVMAALREHPQLREYVPLLAALPACPVVRDAAGTVLSVPPLVNGDATRHAYAHGARATATDVLIEVTGTDLTRVHMALDTLLYAFATGEGAWVEPVDVVYEDAPPFLRECARANADGTWTDACPRLRWTAFGLGCADVERVLGVPLARDEVCACLARMGHLVGTAPVFRGDGFCIAGGALVRAEDATPCPVVGAGELVVFVAPNRTDVIHAADLIEDVAVGLGYDRIDAYQRTLARHRVDEVVGRAGLLRRTELAEYARRLFVAAGYTEMLTFALTGRDRAYPGAAGGAPFDGRVACFFAPGAPNVPLLNPKSRRFTHVRASLLAGLLSAARHNAQAPKPLQLFEVGDVVCPAPPEGADPDDANPRVAQRLHCAALRCAQTDGFESVKGVLDLVAHRVVPRAERLVLREHPLPVFLERRGALVVLEGRGAPLVCGLIGVVAPDVLADHRVPFPASFLELDLGLFE